MQANNTCVFKLHYLLIHRPSWKHICMSIWKQKQPRSTHIDDKLNSANGLRYTTSKLTVPSALCWIQGVLNKFYSEPWLLPYPESITRVKLIIDLFCPSRDPCHLQISRSGSTLLCTKILKNYSRWALLICCAMASGIMPEYETSNVKSDL